MLRQVVIGTVTFFAASAVLLGQERFDEVTVRAGLDRQFSDLDTDDDDLLDEKEISAFPKNDLDALRAHGLANELPVARNDFMSAGVATAMALFQAKEQEAKDAEAEEARRKEESKKAMPTVPATTTLQPKTGSRKNRYVPVLPPEYASKDKNGDGQIGLYEWDRKRYSEFAKLDKNGDGFLTPAELVSKETLQALYSRSAKDGSDPAKSGATSGTAAAPQVAASQPASSGAGASAGAPTSASSSTDPIEAEARGAFTRLDDSGNRDGQLDESEWAKSRMTRQMFEAAGTKVTLPVKIDAFVELYRKAKSAGGRS